MMTPTTGYYSLIQYCPDPSRLEAANVGVLLYAPDLGFLKAVTCNDNRRIQRFFGSEGHDWIRINSFKKGIEERIEAEGSQVKSVVDLELFVAKQANRIRLTPPRPVVVSNPSTELYSLFRELVGGRPRGEKGKQSLKSYLHERFKEAGIEAKIKKDLHIRVPTFAKEVTIPFGYQNGRFRLIQPARFESESDDQILNTACRYAIEGESLFANRHAVLGNLQLVVVGRFLARQSEKRKIVGDMFAAKHVDLFGFEELDRLIEDIKMNGKELPDDR